MKKHFINLIIGIGTVLLADGLSLHGWFKFKFIIGITILFTFLRDAE